MLEFISGKITRLTRLVAAEPLAMTEGPEWFTDALGDLARDDGLHVMRAVLREKDLGAAARASAVAGERAASLILALTGEVLTVRGEMEDEIRREILSES